MVKGIRQRGDSDCTLACIAMLTGASYADVRVAFRKYCTRLDLGTAYYEAVLLLEKLTGAHWQSFSMERPESIMTIDLESLWDQPMLLSIKRGNALWTTHHSLYWDGSKIWEPMRGRWLTIAQARRTVPFKDYVVTRIIGPWNIPIGDNETALADRDFLAQENGWFGKLLNFWARTFYNTGMQGFWRD